MEASEINLRMNLPSFDQNKDSLEWTLKNQCRIDVKNLQMGLDFRQLLKRSRNFGEKLSRTLIIVQSFKEKCLKKQIFGIYQHNLKIKLESYSEICLVRNQRTSQGKQNIDED